MLHSIRQNALEHTHRRMFHLQKVKIKCENQFYRVNEVFEKKVLIVSNKFHTIGFV